MDNNLDKLKVKWFDLEMQIRTLVQFRSEVEQSIATVLNSQENTSVSNPENSVAVEDSKKD